MLNSISGPGIAHTQCRKTNVAFCWLATCLVLCFTACNSDEPDVSPSEGSTAVLHDDLIGSELHVLVMNDPQLAEALQRWQLEWNTISGGKYVVTQRTDKFPLDWANQFDVVIYPADWLGEMVEQRWIMPVRTGLLENENYGMADVFPLIWEQEVRWGGQPYALSLGTPVLDLAFRSDLFAEHRLEPPTTWDEYQERVEFFADSDNWGTSAPAAGMAWQPTVEPLAQGWAARTLLARAAAYARHRNQASTFFDSATMAPLINTPPFERALSELVAAAGPLSLLADPHAAFQALAHGRCVMALTWPSAAMGGKVDVAAELQTTLPEAQTKNIGLDELPGAMDAYNMARHTWEERGGAYESRVTFLGMAGRLGSVSSNTLNAPSANRLLAWITSSGVSQRICVASPGTTLFRMSHVATPEPWLGNTVDRTSARQYTRSVESAMGRSQFLMGLRIPGAPRYMAALDDAVRSAAEGKLTPADALKQTAKAWDEITTELGRDAQRVAYRRNLGESVNVEDDAESGEQLTPDP